MPQQPLNSFPEIQAPVHSDLQPTPGIQATISSPRFPGINILQVELFLFIQIDILIDT